MASPSARLAAVSRHAAVTAMLRLVAAWLAFGLVRLGGLGLRFLVVRHVEPGASGPLTAAFYSPGEGIGETWATGLLAVVLLGFALNAGLIAWAVRGGDRPEPLVRPVLLGAAGLLAHLATFGGNLALVAWLGRRGPPENLAAWGIASNVAGTVDGALHWLLALVTFLALVFAFVRGRTDESDEGPYRSAAS